MSNDTVPRLVEIVDGLLAELREVSSWITELQADLDRSKQRKIKLSQALDNAVTALEPDIRREYEHQIQKLLGDAGPSPTGRPPSDARHDTVIQCLAEWPHDTVTVTELRLELERRGLTGGKNYVSALLRRLTGRGFVMRTGHGRYRVTRLHPHLIFRRHGNWDVLRAHAEKQGMIRRSST